MESQSWILEMIRTTGLKLYLERIADNNEKKQSEALVIVKIKQDYTLT